MLIFYSTIKTLLLYYIYKDFFFIIIRILWILDIVVSYCF